MNSPGTQREVAICICTYRRTAQLANLLPKLALQVREMRPWSVRILIVDNDSERSAKLVVEDFLRKFPDVRLDYVCEIARGVGNARNTGFASLSQDEALIFFDDDQEPVTTWLGEFLSKHAQFPKDVLVGPVIPVLPESSPDWAKGAWAWGSRERPDGSVSENAGFGNILIPARIARSGLCRVPARFLQGPGEDTVVTTRISKAGHVIRHVAAAKAYEPVVQERMTIPWLCERSRISGETWVRVVRATDGSNLRLWLSMFKLTAAVLVMTARSWLTRDPTLAIKIAVSIGRLRGYARALMLNRA